MGQRLVVSIYSNEKCLAKIYYHWSAYTYSALQETKQIIDCIYNHKDETEKEMLLRLIRFCEENGGGIDNTEYEFEYIRNMYPGEKFKTENYSRSYGLIALSEKGMEMMQEYSEGDFDIYLDEEIVRNYVYCYHDDLEYYNKERSEWDDDFEPLTLEDIPDIGYDLGEFSIHDIKKVMDAVFKIEDGLCRHGNDIFEIIA